MAITTVRLTNPFPSPRALLSSNPQHPRSFTLRATDVQSTEDTKPDPDSPKSESSDPETDQFESRVSQVRLRYRSGKGKKAEVRKSKKGSTGTGRSASGMYLPPVALKQAASAGLKVEVGFSPYSERLNGRIAGLGLAALLLVELATGKSLINYHTPAIVLIQLYFVAAVSALYIKYEKEKVSVWPED